MKQFALPKISEWKAYKFVDRHKTAFTTGAELLGFAGTVYLAVKNVTKAEQIIKEQEAENETPLETKEKALTYAKNTWPAFLGFTATSSLITICNVKSANSIKDLSLLALTAKNTADNYKEAVERKLGVKQAHKIEKEASIVSAERSDLHVQGIIDTGLGHELFYDPTAGIWFYCSNQAVKRSAIELANKMSNANAGYYRNFLELINIPSDGRLIDKIVFIRDDPSYSALPSLWLEYGTCTEQMHPLTGEKYAVITWDNNQPTIADNDILWGLDD